MPLFCPPAGSLLCGAGNVSLALLRVIVCAVCVLEHPTATKPDAILNISGGLQCLILSIRCIIYMRLYECFAVPCKKTFIQYHFLG
jgi:hypothetical protein|tara:strand:- start:11567 stop:11824 length:258 start_codon:yes stop_codon:yes gene_type:complete